MQDCKLPKESWKDFVKRINEQNKVIDTHKTMC